MSQPAITVGVDGSPASDAALVYACDDAAARDVAVRAVTVWWVGPVMPEDHALAAEHRRAHAGQVQAAAVARALAEFEEPPVVTSHLVHGEPSTALIEAAHGSSCLVIGSEHKGIWRRVTETSISARCIRNCDVPVIVVPWVPNPLSSQLDNLLDMDLDAELSDRDHRGRAGIDTFA